MPDTISYKIVGGDYEQGGSASRSLKAQLKKVGADPAVVRRAMIAAYEAEMNVVIHSFGGELRYRLDNGQLDVEVVDSGPGIADIEQALKPGFSTANSAARTLGFGAGMGLPNIKRHSDAFSIESSPEKGTTVRFTIRLKSPKLYGESRHSLQIVPEKCLACHQCLPACPTQAVRVFRGIPHVLEYLCVDCAACVAACPTGALKVAGSTVEFEPSAHLTLIATPPVLSQFGAGVSPARALEELEALGFSRVVLTTAWEEALRRAVLAQAKKSDQLLPLISPVCSAVVNLVETKFPSLMPYLAPYLSPIEAACADLHGQPVIAVISCECQRTAVLSGDLEPKPGVLLPTEIVAALKPRLRREVEAGDGGRNAIIKKRREEETILCVSGIRHVMDLLERIEDGLVDDVSVVEAYACEEAGFGSPLLSESPALARHRWEMWPIPGKGGARAVPRKKPYEARPGLRLDDDMVKAIQMLRRIDALKHELPGHDCGQCGAPTCGALAEDIVLGRAAPNACQRRKDEPKT